ncbi:hypothetical protein JF50_14000 [Pseudoalteromonas luteoviolacea]|uniref:Tryptophan 2-monooxygenase n=1 Tax=Pseudoalteromonas luteoviolacea TaxID=43657 RepID=A0A0C1MQQ9_9GAMM|nr:FAD-dependent oxidoreductase [Pseudoalteromonas luteoviolacea]KID56978.1 hypothetical protein JF50_14000 [Pseudoalteromonas luteoviolacea]
MSFISMPKNLRKNKADADSKGFVPKSMIDTLFDYKAFLDSSDSHGSIALKAPEQQKSIAVIGGGASGLVAAYELSKIDNINVTLFEAADRLGGRMDSVYVEDGDLNQKVFELGCMRFPPTSYTLYHYLNKFGLKATPNFPDPGKVPTELLYENKVIPWHAGQPTPSDKDFQRIGDDFNNIINFLLGDASAPDIENPSKLFDYWAIYQSDPSEQTKQKVVDAWQEILTQYAEVTYFDAVFKLAQNRSLVTRPWTQEDMNKFGALGVGAGGFGPLYGVDFVEILRLFANGWEDNQELLLDGIGALTQAFEFALLGAKTADGKPKVSIELNAKVKNISKSADKYELLVSNNGGRVVSSQFDSVIVATTTRAMEYMGLTIANDIGDQNCEEQQDLVSQGVKVAIRNLHLMNSSKFFVTTERKFWYPENNPQGKTLPFNIQTDELMRGLYCLNYDKDVDGKPNTQGKGVVLISYVWGDDSSKLLGLSPEERFQQFLPAIYAVNAEFAELLEKQTQKVSCIDWESTPNIYGAFKLNYPGQEQSNKDAFFQYQQEHLGLVLAGDSISWAGGWLEGAMPTGINAACAAAKYVGAQIIDNSPLTGISKDMYDYSLGENTAFCLLKDNGYLSAPSISAYQFGQGDFSIEATISTSSSGTIVGNKSTAGGSGGYLLVIQPDGSIKFATDNGQTYYQIESAPSTVVIDNTWHSVVAVRKDGKLTLHLDGKLLESTQSGASDQSPLDVSNRLDVLIGSVQQAQEPYIHYTGGITQVRLWRRALSEQEVASQYEQGTIIDKEGLVAHWPLAINTDDISENENNVSVNGDVSFI